MILRLSKERACEPEKQAETKLIRTYRERWAARRASTLASPASVPCLFYKTKRDIQVPSLELKILFRQFSHVCRCSHASGLSELLAEVSKLLGDAALWIQASLSSLSFYQIRKQQGRQTMSMP